MRSIPMLFALLAATPALATPQPAYEARLAAPTTETRLVVRDMLWTCAGDRCTSARKSPSRPGIVCAAVARELGPLAGFRAEDMVLDDAALARCNPD